MKRTILACVIAGCAFILLSFTITRKELIGTWRWLYVENTSSGEKTDPSKMTMGLAKEVKFQFNDDNSFAESKTNSEDGKVSSNSGTWKLNEDGSEITIDQNGRASSSKVIGLKGDTLTISVRGVMQLVMIKEK